MIMTVNQLSFHYNNQPVLSDIHFSVNQGEFIAILGPNGAGKTTLLKCLNAIHHPSSGTILLDQRDILQMSPRAIAHQISYVAQNSEMARLTVYDAVLMGRTPHIRLKVRSKDLMIVDDILQRLEMQSFALQYIDTLSGGQLQKVSIARALVQDPQILLLDEPTSSLDLCNQVNILRLIRSVLDDCGVSVVITMHDLNMALRFADRFIFLKDKHVLMVCTCDEITASLIEEVYELPVEIHTVNGHPFVIPS